jgi:hypothetical protein
VAVRVCAYANAASATGFDFHDVAAMTEATARIGFVLLYNDATRPGWTFYDDDGSFLLKHKSKNMILVSERGGQHGDANRIADGVRADARRPKRGEGRGAPRLPVAAVPCSLSVGSLLWVPACPWPLWRVCALSTG